MFDNVKSSVCFARLVAPFFSASFPLSRFKTTSVPSSVFFFLVNREIYDFLPPNMVGLPDSSFQNTTHVRIAATTATMGTNATNSYHTCMTADAYVPSTHALGSHPPRLYFGGHIVYIDAHTEIESRTSLLLLIFPI